MSRWEPGALGRLQHAALQLYSEQGYEQTTVAEIAQRAGLTERTFYRHFPDKREVLFWGSTDFQALFVNGVRDAPSEASPLQAAAAGLSGVSTMFATAHSHARTRQAVIAGNPELQERELHKMASLATAVAQTLHGRGVKAPAARMTAEVAVAVFRVSFDRWVTASGRRSLSTYVEEGLVELAALTG